MLPNELIEGFWCAYRVVPNKDERLCDKEVLPLASPLARHGEEH